MHALSKMFLLLIHYSKNIYIFWYVYVYFNDFVVSIGKRKTKHMGHCDTANSRKVDIVKL